MDAQEATKQALQPSAEAAERARQSMGLLPATHAEPDHVANSDKKRPCDWAVRKGMLKLNRDKSVHYTTHTPWEYQCAFVVHRWPDPELDPTFVMTQAEFEEAIAAAVAGRSLKDHREHCKREEAKREHEEKREQDEHAKLEAAVAQLDANNRELAAAAAQNQPDAGDEDVELAVAKP